MYFPTLQSPGNCAIEDTFSLYMEIEMLKVENKKQISFTLKK